MSKPLRTCSLGGEVHNYKGDHLQSFLRLYSWHSESPGFSSSGAHVWAQPAVDCKHLNSREFQKPKLKFATGMNTSLNPCE